MNMLRLPSEVQFVAKGLVIIVAVSAGHVSSAVSRLLTSTKAPPAPSVEVPADREVKGRCSPMPSMLTHEPSRGARIPSSAWRNAHEAVRTA